MWHMVKTPNCWFSHAQAHVSLFLRFMVAGVGSDICYSFIKFS